MNVNFRQRRFIDAYLGEANFNATKAAKAAGYKQPGVEGSRMLANVNILAEIERRYRENCPSPDELLSLLADQARGVGEFVKVTKSGRIYVDFDRMQAAGKLHIIKGTKETKLGQQVLFSDQQRAIDLLGRHYKLWSDKEHSDNDLGSALASVLAGLAGGGVPQDDQRDPVRPGVAGLGSPSGTDALAGGAHEADAGTGDGPAVG